METTLYHSFLDGILFSKLEDENVFGGYKLLVIIVKIILDFIDTFSISKYLLLFSLILYLK
jgi:hypothetical protein